MALVSRTRSAARPNRSARAGPRAAVAPGVGDVEQAGVDQFVEVERGQRAPDAERFGDLVAADRAGAGGQHRLVGRAPRGVGQRCQRVQAHAIIVFTPVRRATRAHWRRT